MNDLKPQMYKEPPGRESDDPLKITIIFDDARWAAYLVNPKVVEMVRNEMDAWFDAAAAECAESVAAGDAEGRGVWIQPTVDVALLRLATGEAPDAD